MVKRTYDISDITYLKIEFPSVDTEKWVSNKDNIALVEGDDYSMFEKSSDGIYTGHYFFESRGKKALDVAERMIDYVFTNSELDINLKVIRGLTPLTKLAARWFSRRLGFKGTGVLIIEGEPCELFVLTKPEWLRRKEGVR